MRSLLGAAIVGLVVRLVVVMASPASPPVCGVDGEEGEKGAAPTCAERRQQEQQGGQRDDTASTISSTSNTCSLYLAPSSIPGAGLGVYTGKDLPAGEPILGGDTGDSEEPYNVAGDAFVPIEDVYKTIPYRGQQLFLSWLGYVWPAYPDAFYHSSGKSFPAIPDSHYKVDEGLNTATSVEFFDDEEERISVFAPGIASLVNSHPHQTNILKDDGMDRKDDEVERGQAYTPYHGVTFSASRDVLAGSELFLDYGRGWHDYLERSKRDIRFEDFVNDDDWREKVEADVETPRRTKIEHSIRGVDWLTENGACIDNLRAGTSTLPGAGRGAFARRAIPRGEVVAPAPLLALKRDDLVIYGTDESQDHYRDTLNFDQIAGQELLLNYCYGDPESQLLLLPYSPMVNYINHDGKAPNAKIRWPDERSSTLLLGRGPGEWLDLHPLDVLDKSGRLMMEVVALRDIAEGEEVFVDYGSEWNDAWERYIRGGSDESKAPFRREIGVPDGFFPDTWKNKPTVYEVAPIESPLRPGEAVQMKWVHNGKPVHSNAWLVGLPTGFTTHIRNFSEKRGIIKHYKELLYDEILEADDWHVIDRQGEKWFVSSPSLAAAISPFHTDPKFDFLSLSGRFAQRYKNVDWNVSSRLHF